MAGGEPFITIKASKDAAEIDIVYSADATGADITRTFEALAEYLRMVLDTRRVN